MIDTNVNFQELINDKKWRMIREELLLIDSVEIADIIEELSDKDDIILFRLLSREQAKDVFQNLSHNKQESLIEKLEQNINAVSRLLNDLDPDDRTAFFEELPDEISQRLIKLLSPEERSIAKRLLAYPDESIGRLMTTEFVAVKPHFSVAKTLSHIREYGRDSETLNVVYVVDDNWKLIDEIRIREIILSQPDKIIEEIMDYRFVSLNVLDDQELAIRVFQDQDRVALPVTDVEGILLGIVTVDDVMDVVEEETTEDFHKFGSFQDAIVNPLKASILFLYKVSLWEVLVYPAILSVCRSAYTSPVKICYSRICNWLCSHYANTAFLFGD